MTMISTAIKYFIVDKIINEVLDQVIKNILPIGSRGEFDCGNKYYEILFDITRFSQTYSTTYNDSIIASTLSFTDCVIKEYHPNDSLVILDAQRSVTLITFITPGEAERYYNQMLDRLSKHDTRRQDISLIASAQSVTIVEHDIHNAHLPVTQIKFMKRHYN